MDLSINGKHVDVGDALRAHVEEMLNTAVSKYFDRPLEGTVTFSREGVNFQVDISVHAARGVSMQVSAMAADAYAAFDASLAKIAKRLRRHKRRLRDHHRGRGDQAERIAAQQYVIEAETDGDQHDEQAEPDNLAPVIVAEATTEIAELTVGEAVMRMDLAEVPALMFFNRSHGGMNVVFRRADGNIGWIDPQFSAAE